MPVFLNPFIAAVFVVAELNEGSTEIFINIDGVTLHLGLGCDYFRAISLSAELLH
jgi:hypothetical protein